MKGNHHGHVLRAHSLPAPDAQVVFIGVDPGVNGGAAYTYGHANDGTAARCVAVTLPCLLARTTAVRLRELHREIRDAGYLPVIALEQVGARPGEGSVSTATLARCVGIVQGIAAANFWPVAPIYPQTWHRLLPRSKISTGGRRKAEILAITRARFPLVQFEGGSADAYWISLAASTLYAAGKLTVPE